MLCWEFIQVMENLESYEILRISQWLCYLCVLCPWRIKNSQRHKIIHDIMRHASFCRMQRMIERFEDLLVEDPVVWFLRLLFKVAYFLCFKCIEGLYIYQLTVIKSFGIGLQINCLVTQRPKYDSFFFLSASDWLWAGTHDFSQDEYQDSPLLIL